MTDGGAHESLEQGMPVAGGRRELGMKLAAYVPGMVGELHHLDEAAFGGGRRNDEPRFPQPFEIAVVELVTMPVPLLDDGLP